jgi:hypothetical protein
VRTDGEGVVRLNCNATFGRARRRSGYVAAMHEALKRVATAPRATGAAVAFPVVQE